MKTNNLPDPVFKAACKFKLLNLNEEYYTSKIVEGVSSDIWHVKTQSGFEFCIKRALAKLTVKEDWFAPIDRNKFEARYFKNCKKIIPKCFPKILGHDDKSHI